MDEAITGDPPAAATKAAAASPTFVEFRTVVAGGKATALADNVALDMGCTSSACAVVPGLSDGQPPFTVAVGNL